MALYYKLSKSKRNDETKDLWYARAVPIGICDLNTLAERIQKNVSVKKSDVYGVITELVEQMQIALSEGMKVELGELGSFKPGISSGPAATAKDWNYNRNFKGFHTVFTPKREKDESTGVYTRKLFSDVTLKAMPIVVKDTIDVELQNGSTSTGE